MIDNERKQPVKPVKIIRGIPEHFRYQAAEIYFEAFNKKIGWLLGGKEKGVPYTASVMNPKFAVCAIYRSGKTDKLVGLAGFKTAQGAMAEGGFSELVAGFGFLSALWRALVFSLLQREVEPGVLLMDGIAVAPDQRSTGIGTKLLNAITSDAKRNGYKSVRLDVIDSNPRAQALYERLGFVVVGTEEIGALKYLFGFSSSTKMALRL